MEGGKVGGQSLNDRRLAARVRSLALKKVEEILAMTEMNFEEKEFQKAVILKLAGTILPRLNEHTGEDGEKLSIQVVKYVDNTNSLPVSTTELPTGTLESTSTIQDSSVSSSGGEEQDSVERSNTEDTTE